MESIIKREQLKLYEEYQILSEKGTLSKPTTPLSCNDELEQLLALYLYLIDV